MRIVFMGFCGVAFIWAALPVKADVVAYCEAYARYQAELHLSGSAVLGSKPKLTADEREKREMLALADCLMLYTPAIEDVAAEAEPQPETARPRARPKITAKSIIETVKAPPVSQTDEPQDATEISITTPRAKPKILAKPVIEAVKAKRDPQPDKPEIFPAISLVIPRAKPMV